MVMYGSTMFLLSLVDKPTPDPRMWTMAYSLPELRIVAGGMATSGLVTQWFRDIAAADLHQIERDGGASAYAQLGRLAQDVEAGSDGLICLPYFAGERTPLHDAKARGMFAGLTLRHTRGHLYRSILEGVGYGVRHNLEVMTEMGAAPGRCVAVGGGAQNDLWLQIVSDISGITLQVPRRTIGASFGDAFLAGLATGTIPDVETLNGRWVRIAREITPNPAHAERYDYLYEAYRALYENTKDDIHRLGRRLAGNE
jgi:xylulokinase